MKINKYKKGFTLLEILLVIAAIGILAAIVLVAINPTKQIESARSAQRKSEINSITKAIQQYSIDNNGQYPVGIETGAKPICNTGSLQTGGPSCTGFVDLKVLVPTYIASIPQSDSNNYYVRRSNNNIEVSHPRDSIWNIGGTPSLDLNFAKNKSLIDGVSGNNLISFARNSTGTYIGEDGLIKTAAANEARFDHNPTTRESLGLLIEEERTNLLTYSEQFDNAGWPKFGATITANATTAPDGTTTADKFASTSGAALIYVQQANYALSNGERYTRSVFAKASEISSFTLQIGNTSTGTALVQVNLSTGTATNGAVVTTLPNGWFRISYSYIQSGTLSDFYFTLPANTISGNGIFIWGAQLEAGSFPTSYIPTTSSQVTRAADVASITGANFSSWYNQTEGTVFASGDFVNAGAGSFSRPVALAGANVGIDEISLYTRISVGAGDGSIFGAVTVNSSLEGDLSAPIGQPNLSGGYGSAIAYKANDFGLSSNGLAPTVDTSGTLPTITQLIIMGNVRFQNRLSGHIRRLTYWPARLPNTTLQSLTQ